MPGRIDPIPGEREGRLRSAVCWYHALLVSLAILSALPAMWPAEAAEPNLVKIAVFDFELVDRSAGSGIVELDAADLENLRSSSEQARRMLAASGRYHTVDTSSAVDAVTAGGILHCNGCEVPLARDLGADLSMAGIVTRVTRTEYTLQILIRDVRTGAVLSNDFTGLRMGTNDSWPRGVKWLMDNRVLAAAKEQ